MLGTDQCAPLAEEVIASPEDLNCLLPVKQVRWGPTEPLSPRRLGSGLEYFDPWTPRRLIAPVTLYNYA
jgi:hypothetical protein